MLSTIFWLYLLNTTLLILHEMDSAYWKEWELFHLPGGIGGFLLIHLPLFLIVLFGVAPVREGTAAGMVFSLVVGLAGLLPFLIHGYFLRRGRPEFNTPVSKTLLIAGLAVALLQLTATGMYLLRG